MQSGGCWTFWLLNWRPYSQIWLPEIHRHRTNVSLSRGNSFIIVAGLRWRVGCSAKCPDRLWGPLSLLFKGYRGSFVPVKRPEREADRGKSSVEFVRGLPPLPLYTFMTYACTIWHLTSVNFELEELFSSRPFPVHSVSCFLFKLHSLWYWHYHKITKIDKSIS
jgi:hypothetical protein